MQYVDVAISPSAAAMQILQYDMAVFSRKLPVKLLILVWNFTSHIRHCNSPDIQKQCKKEIKEERNEELKKETKKGKREFQNQLEE